MTKTIEYSLYEIIGVDMVILLTYDEDYKVIHRTILN